MCVCVWACVCVHVRICVYFVYICGEVEAVKQYRIIIMCYLYEYDVLLSLVPCLCGPATACF